MNNFKLLRSFRDINLDLPVKEIDVEASINCDAIACRIKDIADDFTIAERVIGNKLAY